MSGFDWTKQTVLVTGAGGFIGSHLAERLVELGACTRALVRYNSTGSWGWLDTSAVRDQIRVMQGDVRDRDTLREAVRGVDIIFHLAALIGIPYSYETPQSYVRTNVEGTLNVLQEARDQGVRRIVHTSTSEVYGTAQFVPITEEHVLQPQSPYSATKIAADQLAESFHYSFKLPVTIVRPFNTYGPRQSERAVIPTIITQALQGEAVQLGHLQPTRDFNYVSDTVEGFVRVAVAPGTIGKTINIGSGREISIGDLAQIIFRLIGREARIEVQAERLRPDDSEVERLRADNRRAEHLAGWRPQVRLEEGLRRTIEWFGSNLGRYRGAHYGV